MDGITPLKVQRLQPGTCLKLSFIAKTFIFLYVGMDALDIEKWKLSELSVWTLLVLCSTVLFLILLGRAAFVFPLSALSNYVNRNGTHSSSITFKHQVIIWWAGLMRGAVSIALAFKEFNNSAVTWDPINTTMVTTTVIVVLFSTIVFGFLTKPLEPCISKGNMKLRLFSFEESAATNSLSMLIESPTYTIHYYWRRFDDAYMRLIFGGPQSNNIT